MNLHRLYFPSFSLMKAIASIQLPILALGNSLPWGKSQDSSAPCDSCLVQPRPASSSLCITQETGLVRCMLVSLQFTDSHLAWSLLDLLSSVATLIILLSCMRLLTFFTKHILACAENIAFFGTAYFTFSTFHPEIQLPHQILVILLYIRLINSNSFKFRAIVNISSRFGKSDSKSMKLCLESVVAIVRPVNLLQNHLCSFKYKNIKLHFHFE